MPSSEITLSQKILYLSLANIIFLVHLGVVVINAFFWLFPSLFYIFLPTVIITILVDLFWGSCFLSNWEFGLRRKIYPQAVYASSCLSHYAYKFLRIGKSPGEKIIKKKDVKSKLFILMLLLVLSLSLLINPDF